MPKKTANMPVAKRHSLAGNMLRKTARVGATVVATRVAASTGKKGVFGILAGMGAKRLIMRHPVGAMLVTTAYLAGKIYEAKREMDRKQQPRLLTDESKKPIPIEEARKARTG